MKMKKRPLQISFYREGRGWILWRLNLPEKTVKINLSGVFDPLPSIFELIEDVCVGNFPSEIEIDQEGRRVRLVASTLTKDARESFLLKIFNVESGKLLAKSELSKRKFVITLVDRFESFLKRCQDKNWCGYKLEDLPYKSLKRYYGQTITPAKSGHFLCAKQNSEP